MFSYFLDLPEITHISVPKSMIRGDVVTLNCTADGNPVATVRWTRLSDDNDVNMPLAITGEEYEGNYRCTASNSVGSVTRITSIVVNCKYCKIEWWSLLCLKLLCNSNIIVKEKELYNFMKSDGPVCT